MANRPALFPSAFHPHVGGVEELTRQLALEQKRRGMEPVVVANQWPRDLATVDEIDNLSIRRLPFRTPGIRPRQLFGWASHAAQTHRDTANVLRDWNSDLVHVQCVSSNAPFAGRASHALGLPLVVSTQGELSMDANHTFERSAVARSMLHRVLARADIITGCSQYVVTEIDRFSGGKYTTKMRVIYNGIDGEECSKAVPEKRNRPYVLGLGRLVPQKGFDVLIRAFALLASDFSDFELILAGDGSDSSRLRGLVIDHGIEERTHFVGSVDHQRALRLMAGASAFVLSSLHEPQGIVILEAMAVGTPVIASAVGGVPEVVDGANGLLFPANDHRALSDHLREVLGDDAIADELILSGRKTSSHFTWSTLTKEYSAAYVAAAT